MGRQNYVCGFLFYSDEVLLVKKSKPLWQSGLLNGIGGKVENYETFDQCMHREFEEETGIKARFSFFATETGTDYKVHFYRARLPDKSVVVTPAINDVGEPLCWIHTQRFDLHYAVVGNLNWLIPLALDPRRMDVVNVIAKDDISGRPTW